MRRPEYNATDNPSVDTWKQACAVSQQWAFSARRAALRRKRFMRVVAVLAALLLIAIVVVLILYLTGNLIKKD
jgi:hypothetical protein